MYLFFLGVQKCGSAPDLEKVAPPLAAMAMRKYRALCAQLSKVDQHPCVKDLSANIDIDGSVLQLAWIMGWDHLLLYTRTISVFMSCSAIHKVITGIADIRFSAVCKNY